VCELARTIVSSINALHMSFPDYYNSDVILPVKLFISSEPVSFSFHVIVSQNIIMSTENMDMQFCMTLVIVIIISGSHH